MLFLSFSASVTRSLKRVFIFDVRAIKYEVFTSDKVRPGSSVGIATRYGLHGPGIESRWGRDFLPFQTGPGAHPASCTMGIGSFPGVKCGRGVLLAIHPLLGPRSWKSRAILLPPLGHNRACNGVTFTSDKVM